MHAHVFFSVHERVFHPMMRHLRDHYGVRKFSGMVWGRDQQEFLSKQDIAYEPLHVFTRDILEQISATETPNLSYLRDCEERYGVSLHRMMWAERHLLAGRTYDQILVLIERVFRLVEFGFREARPDFLFSEDVSCLTSYVHFAVCRKSGIPFWRLGSSRMPELLSVYSSGLQEWERTSEKFVELRGRELTSQERAEAERFVFEFRAAPRQLPGTEVRAKLPVLEIEDLRRGADLYRKFRRDPKNPTLKAPVGAVANRLKRLVRERAALVQEVFERPVSGERYVFFPLHYQPEASTLVQAPYYLDQPGLIEDISKSLPVGYRLYVKEHFMSRGRRPLGFYRRVRSVPGVRLLGPKEDTWSLIRDASALAVITGTVGWEGILMSKPVVTFGNVFYNAFPLTHRLGNRPKDDWFRTFSDAVYRHRPDEELLLKFVSAIQQTSRPGVMRNPNTFPWVMEPSNVARLGDALAWGLGLERSEPNPPVDELASSVR